MSTAKVLMSHFSSCSSSALTSAASSVGLSVTLDPALRFTIQMERSHVKFLLEILQK